MDFQTLYCSLWEKIGIFLIRERTNPEKLTCFLDTQSSAYFKSSNEKRKMFLWLITLISTNRLQRFHASYIIWLLQWFHLKKFLWWSVMSMCLNFLVIYPKRSWKTTYETRFDMVKFKNEWYGKSWEKENQMLTKDDMLVVCMMQLPVIKNRASRRDCRCREVTLNPLIWLDPVWVSIQASRRFLSSRRVGSLIGAFYHQGYEGIIDESVQSPTV